MYRVTSTPGGIQLDDALSGFCFPLFQSLSQCRLSRPPSLPARFQLSLTSRSLPNTANVPWSGPFVAPLPPCVSWWLFYQTRTGQVEISHPCHPIRSDCRLRSRPEILVRVGLGNDCDAATVISPGTALDQARLLRCTVLPQVCHLFSLLQQAASHQSCVTWIFILEDPWPMACASATRPTLAC